jgi:hypothetical protein
VLCRGIYRYLIAGSQPQAVMLPRLQAAVTAYVTPAELIAYVKAASLLPANRKCQIFFLSYPVVQIRKLNSIFFFTRKVEGTNQIQEILI